MATRWLSAPTTQLGLLLFGSTANSKGGFRQLTGALTRNGGVAQPYGVKVPSGIPYGLGFGMGGLRHFVDAADSQNPLTCQSHSRRRRRY